MSVWVTGDIHGLYDDIMKRLYENNVQKGDSIIVTGDFGFVADISENSTAFTKLCNEHYNFWFIDGNCENFTILEKYPETLWSSGRARIITPNIIHLIRGEVYEIVSDRERKIIFCMGGAYSVDRTFRQRESDWFPQEQPSAKDFRHAENLLTRYSYNVDYILTHTAPSSVIQSLGFTLYDEETVLDNWLEKLRERADFGQWFFGHFHTDRRLQGNFTAIHRKMFRIL